jgi:distribution and morphology protein 31
VSWVFLGHIVWILAGTTTFFSLLILSINTVLAQGQWMEAVCGHSPLLTTP